MAAGTAVGMEEESSDGKLLARFEKHQEFAETQRLLLSLDLLKAPADEDEAKREWLLMKKLSDTLDEYQEQAYLLDPYLEELVTPVVETLKAYAKTLVNGKHSAVSSERLNRVALLLYKYIKFRGYKTITRFFPHEIADLSIALGFMLSPEGPAQEPSQWPLRYAVLLWLSLICMIPFDLEQFDEPDQLGETAAKIESLGRSYLGNAGLERDGAAILLSRLYMRQDTSAKLAQCLEWSITTIETAVQPFPTMGLLQVLCELVKSGSVDQVKLHLTLLLEVTRAVQGTEFLMNNTLIRKLRTKLISRVVLRLLPAKISATRIKGLALSSNSIAQQDEVSAGADADLEVPDEVETILEELFNELQDKDTIVRWSAAKGIARIAERLPADFAEQVLDTVINLFSIHAVSAASIYDMPPIAEATWHGACLACAEMARRGLVADEKLPQLIDWLYKALYFDIRKGAHSVGSNVRDAASYVLWSLARAQGASALAPHAEMLSRRLAAVSVFDREIHIRRAASATFQEFVGRTSLFPHGIDVLRKTDFYAVGQRRNAFLVAAPEVAEHEEYQSYLIDHLLQVTLRHWDQSMRRLGAESLRAICQLDLPNLGPNAAQRAARLIEGQDVGDIHGALLALTELAAAYRNAGHLEPERRQAFAYLVDVPFKVIESPRNDLVTTAACDLIASGISLVETQPSQTSVPQWRKMVDIALKSKSLGVREAAASALASVSKLVDCSAVADRLIREYAVGTPQMQQSLCRVLGVLDYDAHPHGIMEAITCLLACVDTSKARVVMKVEARRNAFTSMPHILANVAPRLTEHLPSSVVCSMIDALLLGLTDYTIDERGDVGSWIRMACVQGLTSFSEILFPHAQDLPYFSEYFPASKYHDAVGGILKQGVERLDNVRQIAGECFFRLLLLPLPRLPDAEPWRISDDVFIKGLFLSDSETLRWNEGERLFPKAVQLLGVKRYREAVLAGLLRSASTKTDSTQRPVSASLITYARTLPIVATAHDRYDLCSFARDLLAQAHRNLGSNNVVVPVLQVFNLLLEADVFERLPEDPSGLRSLRALLETASKNAVRLKNHLRIVMSMQIVVNLLPMPQLQAECIERLPTFLTHQYPKVRSETAEHLYIVIQGKDLPYETEEAEDLLLETEWASDNLSVIQQATQRCVAILSGKSEA